MIEVNVPIFLSVLFVLLIALSFIAWKYNKYVYQKRMNELNQKIMMTTDIHLDILTKKCLRRFSEGDYGEIVNAGFEKEIYYFYDNVIAQEIDKTLSTYNNYEKMGIREGAVALIMMKVSARMSEMTS